MVPGMVGNPRERETRERAGEGEGMPRTGFNRCDHDRLDVESNAGILPFPSPNPLPREREKVGAVF
jgi:hypothetical protein